MLAESNPIQKSEDRGTPSPEGPNPSTVQDRRQVVIDVLATAILDLLLAERACTKRDF